MPGVKKTIFKLIWDKEEKNALGFFFQCFVNGIEKLSTHYLQGDEKKITFSFFVGFVFGGSNFSMYNCKWEKHVNVFFCFAFCVVFFLLN